MLTKFALVLNNESTERLAFFTRRRRTGTFDIFHVQAVMLTSGSARAEAPSGCGAGRVLLTLRTILLLIARAQLIYGALLELGSEATSKLARAGSLADAMLTARSGALVAKGRRLHKVQRLELVVCNIRYALLV